MAMDPNSFASFADAFDHWAKVHFGWSGWLGKVRHGSLESGSEPEPVRDMECLPGVP